MANEVSKVLLEVKEKGNAKAAKEVDALKTSVRNLDDEGKKAGGSSGGLLSFLNKSEKKTGLLTKSFGGLKSMLLTGFALGGLASLGGVLKTLVDTTKGYINETKLLSEATGLGAQQSLYAVAAAKARGVGESELSKALVFLTKNVNTNTIAEEKLAKARTKGPLKETGKLAKDFEKLKIDPKQWFKEDPEKKINMVMAAFEALPDSLAKSALEKELLGKGGTSLAPLLEKGALGWKHQREEAEKYFPKLKGGQATFNEFAANQAKMNMAWEGLKVTLGVKVIPVINELLPKFITLITNIEHGNGIWGTLGRDLTKIYNVGKGVVQFFEKNNAALKVLEGVLVTGGLLLAIEKLYKIYKAFTELKAINLLSTFLGFGGAGAAGAAGGAAEGAGAGILARLAASPAAKLVKAGGPLAAAVAIDYGLGEASHAIFGTPKSSQILHTAFGTLPASRKAEEGGGSGGTGIYGLVGQVEGTEKHLPGSAQGLKKTLEWELGHNKKLTDPELTKIRQLLEAEASKDKRTFLQIDGRNLLTAVHQAERKAANHR